MSESSDLPQASSTTSEADADHEGSSAAPDDASLAGVSDDQLPEDLQPGEDNPLAEPVDPDAEEAKDPEELGMSDTQDDTTGTYRSEGDLESSDSTSADAEQPEDADTDSAASASDAAQSGS